MSILSIGLVVIDVMTEMPSFPTEDTKVRSSNVYEQVGGNAATNSIVLSILGEEASFLGVVGTTSHHLQLIKDTFTKYGIDYSPMIECDGHIVPLSICILCKDTGSRTCLHYRGSLPELSFDMVSKVDLKLDTYKWIHFEGRYDYHDTLKSIQYFSDLKKTNDNYKYKISVEIEKASPKLVELLTAEVDYIFISKDFSGLMGYTDMLSAAQGLGEKVRDGVTVVCPWGSDGAAALTKGSPPITSAAYPPTEIVNTLGAGDTFVAACMKALSNGQDLGRSVRFACRVAGAKCGLQDIKQLIGMNFPLE